MISLSEYITAESICFLTDPPYESVLSTVLRHCLRDWDEGAFEDALGSILTKSRSKHPLDINLGKGFALVHFRQRRRDRIHLALGLLPECRKLLKGDPVHTLLCLVIPEEESRTYLSLLARISRMLSHEDAGEVFQEAGRLGATRQPEAELRARNIIIDYIRDFEEA